jgi:predicted Zn-dependent protease
MAFKTQAFYFDGQISTPFNVELILDDTRRRLKIIKDAENYISNNIYDVDYEIFNNTIKIRFNNNDNHLVVEDKNFIKEFESFYNNNVRISIFKKLISLKFPVHIFITLAVICLFAVLYIFVMPIIAQVSVHLIPVAFDTQIGNLYMKKYIATVEIDSDRTELLNEFAGKITWNSKADLNFFVVESYEVNAFAVPNGSIVVFTGLLNRLDDYESLLALLGHEVTHVNKRHSIQTLSKTLIGYAFISILTTNVSAITAIMIEKADMLGNLSFSRDMELEADNGAIILLEENEVNPEGLLKLMRTLQDAADTLDFEIEILSTHPVMKKRIENINSKMKGIEYAKNLELEDIFKKLRQEL